MKLIASYEIGCYEGRELNYILIRQEIELEKLFHLWTVSGQSRLMFQQ